MKTSFISLAATLLLAASVSSSMAKTATWIGGSAINVNGTWYWGTLIPSNDGANPNHTEWCSGPFNNANLGIISHLELGGQTQVYSGDSWTGDINMYYSIDGGAPTPLSMNKWKNEHNNNYYQSGGSTFSPSSVIISNLEYGNHTIAVWFDCWDLVDGADKDGNNYSNYLYVASFTILEGDGSEGSPYLIKSTDDLDALAISVNNGNGYSDEYFKLENDLRYTGKSYTPIGTEDSPFEGNFDGNGKTISNITINEPNQDGIGVFGYVSGFGTVENLKLSNCSFIGRDFVGSIAGYSGGGISCCFNNNVSVSGKNTVGGIAGYFSDYMSECRHSGSVSGTTCEIGGIAGNNQGNISGCYCNATITGEGNADMIGGIAGSLCEGNIWDCIYEGTITGNTGSSIGGILGENMTNESENPSLMRNYYVATGVKGVGYGYDEDYDVTFDDGAVPAYKYEEIPFSLGNSVLQEYSGIEIITYLMGLYYNNYYYFSFVPLFDSGENENALGSIKDLNLDLHRFQILSRTLYKDGDWNTLCLPFSLGDNVPDDDFTFSGTPLEGAIVKELTSSTLTNDGTLTLNFSEDNLTSIEAGKAYIVKWEDPEDYEEDPDYDDDYEYYDDEPEYEINNPIFTDVTITAPHPVNQFSNDFVYIFQGNFDPYRLTPGNQTELYLGANNTLYYAAEDSNVTIGAFRGYFKYAQSGTGSTPVKSFVLNFGDEETGIQEITTDSNSSNFSNSSNPYISLDGRRLTSQPVTPGLYIHNGRKVMIK